VLRAAVGEPLTPVRWHSAQAVDIEIQAKEIMFHKANLNGIMAEYTGQPIDKVCHLSHQLSCAISRLAPLLHAPAAHARACVC